jgi:regulator of chromosome condensation
LIPRLKKIKSLAAGVNHILALDASGTVFSWGVGENGELGQKAHNTRRPATATSSLTPSPVFLPGIKVVSIACGHHYSFAIDSKGHVHAWGLNNYRQTGISAGTGDYIRVIQLPTRISSLDSFEIQAIAGGFHHSIACCKDGKVLAWGRCHDSQMGLPLDTVQPKLMLKDGQGRPEILLALTVVPSMLLLSSPFCFYRSVPISTDKSIKLDVSAASVAAGIDNSIAIAVDGKPYAWGYSQSYRTGLRTEDSVERPTLITNSTLVTRKMTFAGCGGQFLVLAGPKVMINGVNSEWG